MELHKKSNRFNIRSMFSSKPLYPIGGTMSCSLRRYMVCYYLATLFVLSLDSNTSGLHVNLLAGWTYIGGAGQDSMIGCSISVVSISPLPSLRTWIFLGLMKNRRYIPALNKQINSVWNCPGQNMTVSNCPVQNMTDLSGRDMFKPKIQGGVYVY